MSEASAKKTVEKRQQKYSQLTEVFCSLLKEKCSGFLAIPQALGSGTLLISGTKKGKIARCGGTDLESPALWSRGRGTKVSLV